MAIKGYSAFPKSPALLKPYHQIVLCHIRDILWNSLTPLQRYSQCILQPQLTELKWLRDELNIFRDARSLIVIVLGNVQVCVVYSYAYARKIITTTQ